MSGYIDKLVDEGYKQYYISTVEAAKKAGVKGEGKAETSADTAAKLEAWAKNTRQLAETNGWDANELARMFVGNEPTASDKDWEEARRIATGILSGKLLEALKPTPKAEAGV